MQDFEKLGVFYLGRPYDLATKKREDDLLLYDSKDLVTHAVCVGMTGSGKTGLCLSLLEEAAIDGIPAIVIDPKGDLGNLLLTFPDLAPGGLPAVDRRGRRARARASRPTSSRSSRPSCGGRGSPSGARTARASGGCATPPTSRSTRPAARAGLPVSILESFAAPPPERAGRRGGAARARRRRRRRACSALARHRRRPAPEPRAHPALDDPARRGVARRARTSTSPALIARIQTPPVDAGRRRSTSSRSSRRRSASSSRCALNNLLAAPGFAAWIEGEPLDVGPLLRTPDGQAARRDLLDRAPRDAERMFFVSLLLNQIARLDARAVGHDEPARPPLHGRDLRLLPAGREPAVEGAAADAAEAGARLRRRRRARDAEPGRPRLQGPRRTPAPGSSAGCRPSATRRACSTGSRARPPARRRRSTAAKMEQLLAGARQPRLPAEQRARGRARGLRDALGAVVPARAADARADQDADGSRGDGDRSRGRTGEGEGRAARRRRREARGRVLPPGVPQLFVPVARRGGRDRLSAAVLGDAEVRFADAEARRPATRDGRPCRAARRSRSTGAAARSPTSPRAISRRSRRAARASRTLASAAAQAKSYEAWRKDFAAWLYRERDGRPSGRARRPEWSRSPARARRTSARGCSRRPASARRGGRRGSARSTRRSSPRSRSGSAARSRRWRARSRRHAGGVQTRDLDRRDRARRVPRAQDDLAPRRSAGPRPPRAAPDDDEAERRRGAAPRRPRAPSSSRSPALDARAPGGARGRRLRRPIRCRKRSKRSRCARRRPTSPCGASAWCGCPTAAATGLAVTVAWLASGAWLRHRRAVGPRLERPRAPARRSSASRRPRA